MLARPESAVGPPCPGCFVEVAYGTLHKGRPPDDILSIPYGVRGCQPLRAHAPTHRLHSPLLPILYPEALILTLALLRTARRASYRHLLFCLAPEALPDLPASNP